MKFTILDEKIHPDAVAFLQEQGHEQVDGAEAEILFVRTSVQVDKALLEKYPQTKFVLRAGVGLDNIDLDECKARGIEVFNGPGANANAVAEHIMTLMLLCARRALGANRKMMQGEWDRFSFMGQEMNEKTFGLIGFGAIGKKLHPKVRGFGMDIIVYDPYLTKEQCEEYDGVRKVEDIDELLMHADVISVQVPLTPETKDMIAAEQFEKMKETTIVINISRGGIINERDLMHALETRKIFGAALDVFVNEPDFDKALLDVPNLVLTPHMGALTSHADKMMSMIPAQRLMKRLAE